MIVSVTINGRKYDVLEGVSVLGTCEKLGIHIPHLCYLKGYTPSGVCGMCAIEDGDEIALACLTEIKQGMVITTHSKNLLEIRRAHLSKILRNHNINCLNCSGDGFCMLQRCVAELYGERLEVLQHTGFSRKTSEVKKISKFIYDKSKCISCGRCVKFLNKFCDTQFENIEAFECSDESNDMLLPATDVCPTAALVPQKISKPDFLTTQHNILDISTVFTPAISVFRNENKITRVKSATETYVSDITRESLQDLPTRIHNHENYKNILQTLSGKLNSKTHEKNVFIIGDNLDIVSLYYIKAFAKKFANTLICMNDCLLPYSCEFQIGMKRYELPSIDFQILIGNFSRSNSYYLSSPSLRLKNSVKLKSDEMDEFFTRQNRSQLAEYDTPVAFVSAKEFGKDPDSMTEKLKKFSDQYFESCSKTIKIIIIPTNLSQMLIRDIPNKISISHLGEDLNKHDLQFVCIVGDIDYDFNMDDVMIVQHSVWDNKRFEHIPAKHFTEDSTYHVNVFGEIIKTQKIIKNDLKSHREFLLDLLKESAEDEFSDINDDIHDLVRKNYFS